MDSEKDPLMCALGQRLADLRRSQGLSQKEVAVRLGMKRASGHSYVSRLEQGELPNVGFRTVIAFLRACGMEFGSTDELLNKLGIPRVAAVQLDLTSTPVPVVAAEPKPVPTLSIEEAVDELRQLLTPQRKARAGNAEPNLYWQMMLEVHRVLDEFLCDQPGRVVNQCQFSWFKMLGRRAISLYRHYPPEQAEAKLAELRATWQGHGEQSELHDAVVELALRGWRHWVAKVGEAALKPPPRSKRRAEPEKPKVKPVPEPEPTGPEILKPGSEEWRLRVHRLENRVTGVLYAAVKPLVVNVMSSPDTFRLPNVYEIADKFYNTWKQLLTRGATPDIIRHDFDRVAEVYAKMGVSPDLIARVRAEAERVLRVAD